MNKYYILFDDGKLNGPFSFRVCVNEKEQWEGFGEHVQILKLVVDRDGKVVK